MSTTHQMPLIAVPQSATHLVNILALQPGNHVLLGETV
jgi:hypothetical protein